LPFSTRAIPKPIRASPGQPEEGAADLAGEPDERQLLRGIALGARGDRQRDEPEPAAHPGRGGEDVEEEEPLVPGDREHAHAA
jgi:hypothetical protein